MEVAAANKIKAAIKSFIQRKKFLVILETVRVTKQKQVEKKIAAHMHSLAYAHYSQKARNTPLNSVEPNVSVAFTNYKEKMSVTIKKNLDDLKMNKKDFYQELKKLGGCYVRLNFSQPTQAIPQDRAESQNESHAQEHARTDTQAAQTILCCQDQQPVVGQRLRLCVQSVRS